MLGHLKSGDERVNQIVGDVFGLCRAAFDEIQPISVGSRIETDPLRAQRICDLDPCPCTVKIDGGGHGNIPACISHLKPSHRMISLLARQCLDRTEIL
jgi:hypothetical protein